jgi:hypothetical protein
MNTIRLSKETKKSLLGRKVTLVGDDYIELEGGCKVYLDESEIEMLGSDSMKYKFARKCDVTGDGMNEGYCIGDGDMYIKHEKDLLEYLRQNQGHDDSWTDEQTLEHFYEEGHYFYTDWEVDEDDSWFESNHADGRDAVEVQF